MSFPPRAEDPLFVGLPSALFCDDAVVCSVSYSQEMLTEPQRPDESGLYLCHCKENVEILCCCVLKGLMMNKLKKRSARC